MLISCKYIYQVFFSKHSVSRSFATSITNRAVVRTPRTVIDDTLRTLLSDREAANRTLPAPVGGPINVNLIRSSELNPVSLSFDTIKSKNVIAYRVFLLLIRTLVNFLIVSSLRPITLNAMSASFTPFLRMTSLVSFVLMSSALIFISRYCHSQLNRFRLRPSFCF